MLCGVYLNCFIAVVIVIFKIWGFYEKKFRFFNFFENLEDLVTLDLEFLMVLNC